MPPAPAAIERARVLLERAVAQGRCQLATAPPQGPWLVTAFDGHPVDHLLGRAAPPGHTRAILATPALLAPCVRLHWPASGTRPRAIIADRQGELAELDGALDASPRATSGLLGHLVARAAGHDLHLDQHPAQVLLGWWTRLAVDLVADDARRYHPTSWHRLLQLRPDVLLPSLASQDAIPTRLDPFDAACATPNPAGVHLALVSREDWLADCASRGQALGYGRARPALEPGELAWLGPVMVAGLEMAPPMAPWRDVLHELALDARTPGPMMAGALELAERVAQAGDTPAA